MECLGTTMSKAVKLNNDIPHSLLGLSLLASAPPAVEPRRRFRGSFRLRGMCDVHNRCDTGPCRLKQMNQTAKTGVSIHIGERGFMCLKSLHRLHSLATSSPSSTHRTGWSRLRGPEPPPVVRWLPPRPPSAPPSPSPPSASPCLARKKGVWGTGVPDEGSGKRREAWNARAWDADDSLPGSKPLR